MQITVSIHLINGSKLTRLNAPTTSLYLFKINVIRQFHVLTIFVILLIVFFLEGIHGIISTIFPKTIPLYRVSISGLPLRLHSHKMPDAFPLYKHHTVHPYQR